MEGSAMPTPGRIVLYKLAEHDVEQIRVVRGNSVRVGDVLPMIVVRVWHTGVNGQVMLDGREPATHWVTSRVQGDGAGEWSWPARA